MPNAKSKNGGKKSGAKKPYPISRKTKGKTLGLAKRKRNSSESPEKKKGKKKNDPTSKPPAPAKAVKNNSIRDYSKDVLENGTSSEKLSAEVGVCVVKSLTRIEKQLSGISTTLIKQTKTPVAPVPVDTAPVKPSAFEALQKSAFNEARDHLRDSVYVYLEKPTVDEQKAALLSFLPQSLQAFSDEVWDNNKGKFPQRISGWESKIKKDLTRDIGPFFRRYKLDQQYLNMLDLPADHPNWNEVFGVLEHINRRKNVDVPLPSGKEAYNFSPRKREFLKELWGNFRKNDEVEQVYAGNIGQTLLVTVDGAKVTVEPIVDAVQVIAGDDDADAIPIIVNEESDSFDLEEGAFFNSNDEEGDSNDEDHLDNDDEHLDNDDEHLDNIDEDDTESGETESPPVISSRRKRRIAEVEEPMLTRSKKRKTSD